MGGDGTLVRFLSYTCNDVSFKRRLYVTMYTINRDTTSQ